MTVPSDLNERCPVCGAGWNWSSELTLLACDHLLGSIDEIFAAGDQLPPPLRRAYAGLEAMFGAAGRLYGSRSPDWDTLAFMALERRPGWLEALPDRPVDEVGISLELATHAMVRRLVASCPEVQVLSWQGPPAGLTTHLLWAADPVAALDHLQRQAEPLIRDLEAMEELATELARTGVEPGTPDDDGWAWRPPARGSTGS